jgi:hypothetical protein
LTKVKFRWTCLPGKPDGRKIFLKEPERHSSLAAHWPDAGLTRSVRLMFPDFCGNQEQLRLTFFQKD